MSSVGNFDLRYNLSDISDDDGSKVNDNTTEKRYLPPVEEVSSPELFLRNFFASLTIDFYWFGVYT